MNSIVRGWRALAATAAIGFALASFSAQAAEKPGPQGEPKGEWREQTWLIPLPHDGGRLMLTTVLRPPGEDKRPLAVVNHGSPSKPEARPKLRSIYKSASEWFLKRGYAVALPVRRGYGATGGNWDETYGRCDNPDFLRAGLESAKDIQAAVTYLTRQPFVRPERVLVVGQSAGGWGALAVASRNPPEVAAVVNFAGGRGGYAQGKPNNNCTPGRLFDAAKEYGKTARVPTLWIYAENDLFFSPAISRRMAEAFAGAGGRAEYHLLGPFGGDGHALFAAGGGVERWRAVVEKFLSANGL